MSTPIFPMYFAEIDCQPIFTFRFNLPEPGVGRDDILVYIEYGFSAANHDIITYNVWAQIRNAHIRTFLGSGSVLTPANDEDIIPKIMGDLNSKEEFYDLIHDFISHFGGSASNKP